MRGGEFDGGLSAVRSLMLLSRNARSQGGVLSCDLANVCAFGELVVGIFVYWCTALGRATSETLPQKSAYGGRFV